MKLCTVRGCGKESSKRWARYCPMHATRIAKYGDTEKPIGGRLPNGSHSIRNEFNEKLCHICDMWLNESEFYPHSIASDGLKSNCKMCGVLRKYGINRVNYMQLLDGQGNVCLICNTPPKPNTVLVVDHDHFCCGNKVKTCGKCIRGVICRECNLGLANFKDNTKVLERAIQYLNKSPMSVYDISIHVNYE